MAQVKAETPEAPPAAPAAPAAPVEATEALVGFFCGKIHGKSHEKTGGFGGFSLW